MQKSTHAQPNPTTQHAGLTEDRRPIGPLVCCAVPVPVPVPVPADNARSFVDFALLGACVCQQAREVHWKKLLCRGMVQHASTCTCGYLVVRFLGKTASR